MAGPAMRFFLLDLLGDANDASLCVITGFAKGIEMDAYRVKMGEAIADIWPADARIDMSRDQKGIKLSSVLGTTRNMLIAHRTLRDLVEEHCPGVAIEYLPFALHDHRKRLYSKDYWIVNPLGTFDCLDLEKSDIVWDKSRKPPRVSLLREPVLDRRKVEKAPQLFRIQERPAQLVVGVGLAKAIHDAKLTNVMWRELRSGDQVKKK